MSHSRWNVRNLEFRKCTRFITTSCCCDSVIGLIPPIRYIMKNIILKAHKEEIAPQSLAINSKNHQNLRLLKRFHMSINIKTQYNTMCLNSLLRLSSPPLTYIQEHLRKISIIHKFQWLAKAKSNFISLFSDIPSDDNFGDFNGNNDNEVNRTEPSLFMSRRFFQS